LERGYSLAYDGNGHLLTDASTLQPGDTLTTRLARGSVESRITRTSPQKESSNA
jgi:exodeoxyribonuclease VII large subunit